MHVKKGVKKYRLIMNSLSSKGVLVSIHRVNAFNYNFIENGVIIKTYKKRESCNKRLLKLEKHLHKYPEFRL